MLITLKIENLATIAKTELPLEKGLICLSGETGAGKTLVISALQFLLGKRADVSLIRSGAEKLVVEAQFQGINPNPEQLPLWEDELLILRRELTDQGRSRAFINGAMVSVTVLGEYASEQMEVHGQHGQQSLLGQDQQRLFLDQALGLVQEASAFEAAVSSFDAKRKAYAAALKQKVEQQRTLQFLDHQIGEIESVRLVEEDRDLDQRISLAERRVEHESALQQLSVDLEDSLLPLLRRLARNLRPWAEMKPTWQPYMGALEESQSTWNELAGEVAQELSLDRDPEDLDHMAQRQNLLNRLFMTYGRNVDEVLVELERLRQQRASLLALDESLAQAESELEKEYQQLVHQRHLLHDQRCSLLGAMVEAVNGHLRDLSLGQACFSVTYDWASWPSTFPHQGGLAEPCIQFQWQPNPGEPPRPLIKIASGGELSRLMLALLIVGAKDRQKTLFFDEIDTGVGGETAIPLGKKLADLAVFQQVWCITHLAQVAQFAHQHVLVVKEVVQDRTFTTLSPLDAAARQQELARLLGGDTKSEALLQHAKAMLNQSQGGQV